MYIGVSATTPWAGTCIDLPHTRPTKKQNTCWKCSGSEPAILAGFPHVYMYIFVTMYIYIYACMYVCIYIYMCIQVYLHMYIVKRGLADQAPHQDRLCPLCLPAAGPTLGRRKAHNQPMPSVTGCAPRPQVLQQIPKSDALD